MPPASLPPAAMVNKDIPIGLLGLVELLPAIERVLKSFPSFRPIVRASEEADDVARLARELLDKEEIEVLFMTDERTFHLVKEQIVSPVPMHYLPLSGAGFFRSLSFLMAEAAARKMTLESVTVDTFPAEMLRHLAKEAGPYFPRLLSEPGLAHASREQAIEFHLSRAGAGVGALTADRLTAARLQEAGVLSAYVEPADNDIVVSLERALLATETRRSRESQIVVGMVDLDNFDEVIRSRRSEHDVQKLKLDVQRTLLDFIESLDGYFTPLGANEYLFFTTRGIFERETGGYKYITLATQAQKRFGLSLSIGIGFGVSANLAGTNARTALRSTKDAGGGACFIVREDQTYIGPLEMSEPLQYDLSFRDPEQLRKAEEAGLTTAYLSRLFSSVSRSGKLDFTAGELAALLDLTVRSANRLLVQWTDAGFVEPGQVIKKGRGRPTQVYELSFLRAQLSEHGISLRP